MYAHTNHSHLHHSTIMTAAVTTVTPSTWTHKKLIKTLLTDELTIVEWLQSRNLLASEMTRSKCGNECQLVPRRGSYSWRCPSKGCQCFKSIRERSFFSRSHLKLETIIELMYFWSTQVWVYDAAAVSNGVAIDWFNFFRDIKENILCSKLLFCISEQYH